MKHAALLLSLAVVLAACGTGRHDSSTAGKGASDTTMAQNAKLVLPFRADDYTAALQEARQRNLPIFIETWAPW